MAVTEAQVIASIVSARLAGRLRALLPKARRKRQDAHGGAVSLFRMRPVAHQALDQDGGVGPDFGGRTIKVAGVVFA